MKDIKFKCNLCNKDVEMKADGTPKYRFTLSNSTSLNIMNLMPVGSTDGEEINLCKYCINTINAPPKG